MTQRSARWMFLVVVLCAVSAYAGYYFYSQYQAFSYEMQKDNALAQQIAATEQKLTNAFSSSGVSPQQIASGFWYSFADASGSESVGYADVNELAEEGLSDADIAALAARVGSSTISDRNAMHFVAPADMPPHLQFHNLIYSAQDTQFQSIFAQLQKAYANNKATSDQLWDLAYMYEMQGDYAKRDEVDARDCTLYKQQCKNNATIVVHGVVQDSAGRPIQGAAITVISRTDVKPTTTDVKGNYTLSLSAKEMEKIRISAVKRNYSNGNEDLIVVSATKKDYSMPPLVLGVPITIVTIDTDKHTVSDPNDTANPDGSFILHATSSTYDIPAGAIVHKDGSAYHGEADVYLYEFTRTTVPQSLVTLDIFDEVSGYVGNMMLSYGMPYIQFFAPSGEELQVVKSDPMTLTYRLAGINDLKKNTDHRPTGPLTDADLQTLVNASQGDPGFPITAKWMADNHLFTFPPFWVFDRGKGVWENVGMRVLDTQGTIQVPFYTINNQ